MSTVAARLHINAAADLTPATPHSKPIGHNLENATGGQGWRNGTASGQVDRVLRENYTLGASATDSFNLLAAGSLTDMIGQAIDADELKGLVIKCTSGEVTLEAPASNGLGFFKAAQDGIVLASGQTLALDLGAAGLDVTTNASFDVTDSGGAGSNYELWLVLAQ
jgi:hypothetical protein